MRSNASSFSSLSERQILPNETLTNILLQLAPWDAWPLRIVCTNFNNYITRYLAPRWYLAMTYIYIRPAPSWIFTTNRDYATPSPEAINYPEPPEGWSSANPTLLVTSHRGEKLSFSRAVPHESGVGLSHIAEFTPARNDDRNTIRINLMNDVQVIFRVGPLYYRHVHLPSLTVDRETLTMSFDWYRLYNHILTMPESIRARLEAREAPSILWNVRNAVNPREIEKRDWEEVMSDTDSDSDHERYREEPEEEDEENAVSDGDYGEEADHEELIATPRPRIHRRGSESSLADEHADDEGGSQLTADVSGSSELAAVAPPSHTRHVVVEGESFLHFDDSQPEDSSDSAGVVVEVVYKEVGVQVHPIQVKVSGKAVARSVTWP